MLRKTRTPTLEHRYGPWLFSRLPSIVDYYIKNITETAIQGMMDPFLQETCEMPEELNVVRWNCTSGFRGTVFERWCSRMSIPHVLRECQVSHCVISVTHLYHKKIAEHQHLNTTKTYFALRARTQYIRCNVRFASSIQQCQNECVQRYGESSWCDCIFHQNSKCIVHTSRTTTDNEPVADANFEFCSFYTETIVTDWLRTTIGTAFGGCGESVVKQSADDPRESQVVISMLHENRHTRKSLFYEHNNNSTCTGLCRSTDHGKSRGAFNTPTVDNYTELSSLM